MGQFFEYFGRAHYLGRTHCHVLLLLSLGVTNSRVCSEPFFLPEDSALYDRTYRFTAALVIFVLRHGCVGGGDLSGVALRYFEA